MVNPMDLTCRVRYWWIERPTRQKKIIMASFVGIFLVVLIPSVSVASARSRDRRPTDLSSDEPPRNPPLDEPGSTEVPASPTDLTNSFPVDAAPTNAPTPWQIEAFGPSLATKQTPAPSMDPQGPTLQALVEEGVTYSPGLLNVSQNGLLLSQGLQSRIIARTDEPVLYYNGELSKKDFHGRPDFGACFPVPRDSEHRGGWVYVSNSEMFDEGEGGVGALTFNKYGEIIDYRMLLTGTTMNCGGGRTPWNTWVSCEEKDDRTGQIYQVDPFGNRAAQVMTIGDGGGRFESFAYDDRDHLQPRFFVSEDRKRGATRRFTPSEVDWNSPWDMLHSDGIIEFLVLEPTYENATQGTFRWTTDKREAKRSAQHHYPETEGIDRAGNKLYLVCKKVKWFFILNLDTFTYHRFSTEYGVFDGSPDQVKRILDDQHEVLYFTEERGKDAGVHGRNSVGQFFTILEGGGETTGLSFSPDGMHMYFAIQSKGILFDITRADGLPFHGKTLNVNYHNKA